MPRRDARDTRTEFERAAEKLVVYQLDLLAQLEAQLRAAHHTMRRIEQLRAARHRRNHVTVSNGMRHDALVGLSGELGELDRHVATQLECTRQMEDTIRAMQRWLAGLRGEAVSTSIRKASGSTRPRRRRPGARPTG